jgi:Mn2+/Fe2+ NRAMP family transporter
MTGHVLAAAGSVPGSVGGGAAVGLGILAGACAAVFMWRNHKHGLRSYKKATWLAGISGALLATSVAAFAGSLAHISLFGIPIEWYIIVVGGLDLLIMMKGHGYHALWTPISAFIIAVAVVLTFAQVGQLADAGANSVVTTAHHNAGG